MNPDPNALEATLQAGAAEVQRLTAELAQLRSEYQDFVYTVSHDLRAPLRHISAFTQVIAEDLVNAPPDILAHLGTIRQSALLLTQQLDGLLALSRLGQQPLRLQAVPVVELLHAAARECALRYPQKAVQWQLAPDVPPLWADAELVRQLLDQLLDNAVKFSGAAALVAVSWQAVAVGQASQPECCEITVRDSGVGFAPAQASKLFKVFAKLHPARDYGGLGMGLVSCLKIVQRLGGSIAIAAEVNTGCRVTLRLPLAAPAGRQTCCVSG